MNRDYKLFDCIEYTDKYIGLRNNRIFKAKYIHKKRIQIVIYIKK